MTRYFFPSPSSPSFAPLWIGLTSSLSESSWFDRRSQWSGSTVQIERSDDPIFFLFFFIFRGECKRSTLLRLWRMVSFDRCHYRCASLKRSGVVKSIHDWMIFFETKNVSQLAIQVYLKKKKKKKGREKRRRKKR